MIERPPNILLIVADCARSDAWLGPNRRTRTPNVDRLAAEGISLPTTIVEKACTTPSFATLLTGRYSPRHGVHLVWGYRLPGAVPMLTEELSRNGYHAYAEVSGPLLPEMGLDRGFENYSYRAPCDGLHTVWGERFIERLRTGHYRQPWFIMLHLWELHPERRVDPACDAEQYGGTTYERAVSSLDAQIGRVMSALDERTLTLFTGDHGEKAAAEEYRPGTAVDYARKLLGIDEAEGIAPFGVAAWAGPSVLQELYGQCAPLMRQVRVKEARRPRFTRWQRWRDRLALLRLTPMIFLQDLFALGAPLKLTRMLEKRGLLNAERARRKVAGFTKALGRERLLDMHMRMWINSYKRNLDEGHILHVYDFLVKVPLVLHWPGRLAAGRVHARMVRQPDIFPTLLDLLNIQRADGADIDGRSFKSLLDGERWECRPAFLSVSGTPVDLELHGVRTEDYKYTYGPENDELPQELYDLHDDPGETRNLAGERPEVCAALRALAREFASDVLEMPPEEIELSADDERRVQEHLRNLGYIE